MKVFIGWSGPRSKQVAQALREWLPDVIQDVDPWMSETDIDAGARWTPEVAEALESSNFGIVCLTRDNPEAPWLLFEAGALSKVVSQARVCVYLLDLNPEDYSGPFTLFQAKRVDESGTKAIVRSINTTIDKPLEEQRLDKNFGKHWLDLKEALDAIPASAEGPGPERPQEEMVAETLQLARAIMQSQSVLNSIIDGFLDSWHATPLASVPGSRGPLSMDDWLKRKASSAPSSTAAPDVPTSSSSWSSPPPNSDENTAVVPPVPPAGEPPK